MRLQGETVASSIVFLSIRPVKSFSLPLYPWAGVCKNPPALLLRAKCLPPRYSLFWLVMVAENSWDIPGFFLLVLDTRECNIDMVLLNGMKVG